MSSALVSTALVSDTEGERLMSSMPIKVRAAFDQWYGQSDDTIDGDRSYANGAKWYIETYKLVNTPANVASIRSKLAGMSRKYHWHDLARWRDWRRQEMADKEASRTIARVKKTLAERGLRAQIIAMEALEKLHERDAIGATAAGTLLKIGIGAQLRGYDLPETIQRQEVTGKDGGSVTVDHVLQLLPPHLREEAIALARKRLTQGEDTALPEDVVEADYVEIDEDTNEEVDGESTGEEDGSNGPEY